MSSVELLVDVLHYGRPVGFLSSFLGTLDRGLHRSRVKVELPPDLGVVPELPVPVEDLILGFLGDLLAGHNRSRSRVVVGQSTRPVSYGDIMNARLMSARRQSIHMVDTLPWRPMAVAPRPSAP